VGPDLLGGTFDAEAALRNLRARGSVALGEALLDQRVLAGIGNIYKSELLFRHGLDPFAAVERFTDDELRALLADAEVLLRRNAEARSGRRITKKAGHPADHSVYLRVRRPCFDCGALIRSKAQELRTTYYCPRCQPPRG
jgi:endonuclease-8